MTKRLVVSPWLFVGLGLMAQVSCHGTNQATSAAATAPSAAGAMAQSPLAPRKEVPLGASARFEMSLAVVGEGAQAAGPDEGGARGERALDPAAAASLWVGLPPLPAEGAHGGRGKGGVSALPRAAVDVPPAPPAAPGAVVRLAPFEGDASAAPVPMPVASITRLPAPEIWPQGRVTYADKVRVVFARAMVPLSALGLPSATGTQPAGSAVASLSPQPEGQWRWEDTRTLVFESKAPFAQATTYEVRVAAGQVALDGGVLASAANAVFSTAPVGIEAIWPIETTLRPDDPIAMFFDQEVDAAALAPFLRFGKDVAWEVVSPEVALRLWARNPSVDLGEMRDELEHRPPKSVIIAAPKQGWPAGARLAVRLLEGAPSLEGPLRSGKATAHEVSVAAPFTVRGVVCGARLDEGAGEAYDDGIAKPLPAGEPTCSDAEQIAVRFSNPVRESEDDDESTAPYRFDPRWIQLRAPQAAAAAHDVWVWDFDAYLDVNVTVGGVPQRRVVRVDSEVQDVYGQRLDQDVEVGFVAQHAPQVDAPYLEARGGFFQLDPGYAHPHWRVVAEHVASVRISLYQVEPSMFEAFTEWTSRRRGSGRGASNQAPPGRKVAEVVYPVGAHQGREIRQDLGAGLQRGIGHVVAVAEAMPLPGTTKTAAPAPQIAWIARSNLSIAARVDGYKAYVFVSDAITQAPVPGARVALSAIGRGAEAGAGNEVVTDASGLAEVPLLSGARDVKAALTARMGGDAMFLQLYSRWQRVAQSDELLWFVEDDRGLYQPGEILRLKGFVRVSDNGPDPSLRLPARPGMTLAYKAYDDDEAVFAEGRVEVSAHGGFDLALRIPADAALGHGRVVLTDDGGTKNTFRHPFALRTFSAPRFAVDLERDVWSGGAPVVAGEEVQASVAARYWGGGGLGAAAVSWRADVEPASFSPPGWDGFVFEQELGVRADQRVRRRSIELDTSLDRDGQRKVALAIGGAPFAEPAAILLEATVTDLDRTAVRAQAVPLLVHPSALYVGLRPTKGGVEAIVTDLEGEVVPDVDVRIEVNGYLPSEFDAVAATPESAHVCQIRSAAAPVACAVPRSETFRYAARAEIRDARGRVNRASIELWPWDDAGDASASVRLRLDRARYAPGDTAQLTITTKAWPTHALLTVARQGVLTTRRIELTSATTTVPVAIARGHAPNLQVIVDVVTKEERPGYAPWYGRERATAAIEIDVAPMRLTVVPRVAASAAATTTATTTTTTASGGELRPGGRATFSVRVADASGAPVAGAEVALMAVDEAVLALTAKRYADPMAAFYPRRRASLWDTASSALIPRAREGEVAAVPGIRAYKISDESSNMASGFGRGMGSSSATNHGLSGTAAALRVNFSPTAVFAPALVTGADGIAQYEGTLPDSATSYRIVAVASARDVYFGKGETSLRVSQPLQLRLAGPAALHLGDEADIPVVVQNLTARSQELAVGMRAVGIELGDASGKRLTLAPGARAEVRFRARATQAGMATVQVAAKGQGISDALQHPLPVHLPTQLEQAAVDGELVNGVAWQRVEPPRGALLEQGGVSIALSSSRLQLLTDAYLYLTAYAYDCGEQVSARLLATQALRDVLDAMGLPKGASPAEVDAQVARDHARLLELQQRDGGFGLWPGSPSNAYVTAQAAHALLITKGPAAPTARALAYLARVTEPAGAPAHVSKARARGTSRGASSAAHGVSLAYGLYVRHLAGHDVTAALRRVWISGAAKRDPSIAALLVLASAGNSAFAPSRAVAIASLRTWAMDRGLDTAPRLSPLVGGARDEAAFLVSDIRTISMVLLALKDQPEDDQAVAVLSRRLLQRRSIGRWPNTQQNAWAILALRAVWRAREAVEPAFTARVWMGDALLQRQEFVGRQLKTRRLELPWVAFTPPTTAAPMAIQAQGKGRLFYRLAMAYAPAGPEQAAVARGFWVERSYAALDDPADVSRETDGTWRIRLGARVKVFLQVVVTATRDQVAVVDRLPAGLTPIGQGLTLSERVGDVAPPWARYQRINLARIETFADGLSPGTYTLGYTARATAPGRFTAPPAYAEEMYLPEHMGKTGSARVVVTP